MALTTKKISEAEQKIHQMEQDLKKLQVFYDAYFAGGRKRPPGDEDFRFQRTIKQTMDQMGKMKYAERFRFNNIAQRYAKFSEIWRQRSARMEQGHTAFGYSRTARELEKKRLDEAEATHHGRLHPGESRTANVDFSDPAHEPEKVQELYKAMMDSKKKAGETPNVSYEQFHKFVAQKTQQLQQKMGVKSVQYSVAVKDGKVTLKARGAK